jgi:putative ABC transport system permease protein
VEYAIPVCLGDSYEANGRRFRVVATTPRMFEINYAENRSYRFAQGRNLHQDYQQPEHFLEAVIGSVVARQTGLKVGDTFRPEHGISEGGVRHDAFTIVGVLEPTGTPNDRALFVNIEGFFVLEGHSKDGQKRIHEDGRIDPLPLELREITAILIRTSSGAGQHADLSANGIYNDFLGKTDSRIAQGNVRDFSQVAQAVYPMREIDALFRELVGPMRWILLVLAWLVVVVAGVAITVGIYNSMNDRLRDIAVMRALGASRFVVMLVVLLESSLLALLGGVVGANRRRDGAFLDRAPYRRFPPLLAVCRI